MSTEQCWSLQSNGKRCEEPAAPSTHFCAPHTQRGGGSNPLGIWRAPEAEMPPDLVAAIRRAAPGASFRPPAPPAPQPSEPLPLAASSRADPVVSSECSAHQDRPVSPPDRPCPSVSPCLRGDSDRMDWLLATLQQAMTEVMASEAAPLQKGNTVARLAALYLKASHVAELEQANAALAERAAAAEAYTADLEVRVTAWAERLEAAAATAPDGLSEAGADISGSAPPTESGLLSLMRAQVGSLGGLFNPAAGDM